MRSTQPSFKTATNSACACTCSTLQSGHSEDRLLLSRPASNKLSSRRSKRRGVFIQTLPAFGGNSSVQAESVLILLISVDFAASSEGTSFRSKHLGVLELTNFLHLVQS